MRVVVAAGGAAWEAAAVNAIENSAELTLVRRCVDVADLLAAASAEIAQLAIVSTSLPGLDLDVVDRLRKAGVRPVAVREGDPDAAQRLGLDSPVEVTDLDRLAALAPVSVTQANSAAHLIAVWGPTGAPGRSSVALAIASSLAAQGRDTVLIDADVEGGAQAQALGLLEDTSGLIAAVRSANQGRPGAAVEAAREVEPRLRLLTGLPRADMASQLRPAAYGAVLNAMRASAESVVVDCGFSVDTDRGGRGATTAATLEEADEIIVVGRADPLGLSRLVRALHDLATVAPGRSPQVLINHSRRGLGWSEREVDSTIQRLTGIVPALHLPWDQPSWDSAAMTGRSIRTAAPSSQFVARIEALAARLTPVAAAQS